MTQNSYDNIPVYRLRSTLSDKDQISNIWFPAPKFSLQAVLSNDSLSRKFLTLQ